MIRVLRCAAVLLAALWAFGVGEAAAQISVSAASIGTYDPQTGDTYGRGEVIGIEVTFTSAVRASTDTRLGVQIGSSTVQFTCDSSLCGGSLGLSTWRFAHTVRATDSDTDGIRVQTLTGTFTPATGSGSVNLTISGNTVDAANYKVDGTLGVAVSGLALNSPLVGDTYGVGEVIEVTVTFTGAVDVTGTPRVRMRIGSNNRDARYATGHGTTSLTFRYTVVATDTDTNGLAITATNGLRIGSGTTIRATGTTRDAVRSLAGNTISDSASHKVNGASSFLTVSGLSLNSPASGDTFRLGENIEATVTFGAAVAVTGTPQLALTVGANARQADYNRGTGSTMLVFRYTVVAADTDTDGITIGASALTLNSGAITSSTVTTVNAVLGLGTNAITTASANHKVDGAIRVTGVSLNSPGSGDTFGLGENIEATVTFTNAVDVTGTPQVALTIGTQTRQADYNRGDGTTSLVFRYTVAATDSDTDGVSIGASALALNSGTIRLAGSTTNATLSLTGNTISDSTNHKVDGVIRVTNVALNSPAVGDTFRLGENIEATVTFGSAVDVTGTPQVALTIGTQTRQADYNRGDGTTSLVFRYTVVAADVDTDGVSIGASALALNSGMIRQSGGTANATLSLTGNTISDSTNHKVDGAIRVTSVALNSPGVGDTFQLGERIEATVTFTNAVDVTGTPQVALTIGTQTRQADYNRGHGTTSLVFRYAVIAADADTNGVSIGASALALNGGTIRLSGSTTANATLSLTGNTISDSTNHKVDGSLFTAASVSGASIASRPRAGGVYGAGEEIEVWVTFSNAVTVTGTPQLALAVGAETRQADYGTAGSTARTLVFSYTVVAADVDQNGISVAADALTLNSGTINDARSATTAATLSLGSHAIGDASGHRVNGQLADDGGGGGGGPPPSQVTGVRVLPLDGGLRVSWSAATGSVSQYRVDVADASGALVRRAYAEAAVREAVVDGLANGVVYTVTVSALPGHGGAAGPPSEPRTTTPQVGARDPDGGGGEPDGGGEPGEVPVPALPLAGAGLLAALLASAAYRFRSAGRRASPASADRCG